MNRPEAEQIATAITIYRPKWLQTSLVTLLGRHKHRPARDVALALTWLAFDPETDSPGRLDHDGPWWHVTQVAGIEPASTLPYYDRAPIQREANPATPDRAAEHIAAIRQSIRQADEAS